MSGSGSISDVPADRGPSVGRLDEERLASRMADVASAGLPLAAGLRVMAEELHGRDRRVLLAICSRLEAGESPDRAIAAADTRASPHLVGIVRAGMRSGRLGAVLDRYVERSRDRGERRRRVWTSLAYPIVLAIVATLLIGFLLVFIVPGFSEIFEAFGIELPGLTAFVLWISSVLTARPVVVLAVLGGLVLVVGLLMLAPSGAIAVRRCLYAVPVLGPVVRYNGLASFCDLLGLIVSQRVPLPEALRMTAAGVHDPELSRAANWMAEDLERGIDPKLAPHDAGLPAGLQQAFHWCDDDAAFADSLTAAARIFDARATTSADLVQALLGPVVIVLLAITIGTIVIALFLPLVTLLNALS